MNITLIGMAGVGKSSVGKRLAKKLNYSFIDVDDIIEQEHNLKLQQLIDRFGDNRFIELEEKAILSLDLSGKSVISPGGSAIYSEKAMSYLKDNSKIIFLDSGFEILKKNLKNANTRGIVGLSKGLDALFKERLPLYKRYADIIIEMDKFSSLDDVASEITKMMQK